MANFYFLTFLFTSEALTGIESSINSKLIEENQCDQHKKYSVFEGPQDGRKHESVSFMIYDLAVW